MDSPASTSVDAHHLPWNFFFLIFIFIIIIIIFIYFFLFGSNPLNSFQSKSGPSQEDSNFYSGQKKKLIKK